MTSRAELDSVLDEFHAAAADADEQRYLATQSDDMVFLGTAPGERWEGAAWRTFVHGHFSQGRGWTYVASARTVVVAHDGETAWFDETVDNAFYGTCRGSGVLRRANGVWKLEQYNLTIPVPDELAGELAARIREARPT